METGNIDEELETAVIKGNLGEVKRLLSASAGANINCRFRENSTLLHLTRSAEITKELLSHGAYVNATNGYRETPLLFAIKEGKPMELVRELLKHGADVSATDRKGNTALNISVKKSNIDLTVIKELLKYGADINKKNWEHRCFDNCAAPLDHALGSLACAKLFIKFTLLNNFKEGYRNIIDLNVYKGRIYNYSELSLYEDECVSEIHKMKTDMITDNLSLFELIINNINLNISCSNQLSIRLAKYDYSLHYPVYKDIISEKIEPFIERASLLNKISELHIYTESGVSNQDVKEKIILDPDAVYTIAEYLSNNELSNLIIVFYDFGKQTNKFFSHANDLELNRQPDTRLSKASTSIYSNLAKRARLE